MAATREPRRTADDGVGEPARAHGGVQSVEVGARVLFALEAGGGPMTLTDVAREADLHPAKVHRYLASLMRVGLASQNPSTGLYDLGPRLRHLGIEALRRTNAVSTVSAHATELRDETGHTVNIGVWTDQGPTLVRWDAGAHQLPIVVRVGSVLPLLESAVGCVFLTYLPAASTRDVLRVQQREQKTRRAGAGEIEEIKAATRRDRYARTINRMIFGEGALAAPVFGADERVEAVIGLVLPSALMTDAEARRLGGQLRGAADRASAELGSVGAETSVPDSVVVRTLRA